MKSTPTGCAFLYWKCAFGPWGLCFLHISNPALFCMVWQLLPRQQPVSMLVRQQQLPFMVKFMQVIDYKEK
ncbi:hypothetical protein [Aquitalea sp. LB_tupeE]|uniref:hypothetical protein n=1 Tax=Aquitalea sp. LB_tupeE TaxID=2748078 RepID=UPI0015C0C9D1|nr:hypothetical protein [Aquitalea sp. LB_tupeE]NWK79499.1 hypothetical protein [Aquitalea sp. LB_tupeE]